MSKKKRIVLAIILIFIALLAIGGLAYMNYYFIDEDEIILKSDYDEQMKSDVENQRISFLQTVHGKKEENEKQYDLKEMILEDTNVKFVGTHTIKDTSIKCEIEAYDIYQYVMDNIETMYNLKSTEEFVEHMKKNIKDGNVKKTTKELELPCEYKDKKLIVNNYSDEYKDAELGGAYTVLYELKTKAVNEYMKDMYELNEYVKNLNMESKGNESE